MLYLEKGHQGFIGKREKGNIRTCMYISISGLVFLHNKEVPLQKMKPILGYECFEFTDDFVLGLLVFSFSGIWSIFINSRTSAIFNTSHRSIT